MVVALTSATILVLSSANCAPITSVFIQVTLVRPAGAADAEASVRTIRAGHLSDVTVNVVEREAGAMEGVRVARAWVFHDDIFIFISEDHRLYTSVEVKNSFIYNKK